MAGNTISTRRRPARKSKMSENRLADLAKIHIAKKQLDMNEASYRAMLKDIAGVDSAAQLDDNGRNKVIDHLETLGFKPRPARPLASSGQYRKIRMLWLDLHAVGLVRDPSERAMRRYIERMTGIERPYRLSREQASLVIETLKKWRQRVDPH